MTAVRIRDLRVVRGTTTALDGVGCDVAAARVTGLLGPSGSGKTTLMRCIVGVQAGVRGTVEVLGRPAGDAGLRRKVAYVTQAPSVYGDLTVRENLRYFGRIIGAGTGAVGAVLATVELDDRADVVVGRLSGGEQARVSLATALLGAPELLVLDEPTVGLDPVLRHDLWRTFGRLAEAGTTLLVSSHVMDEADRCDRLLLLRAGRLLADSTPDELRRQTGETSLDTAFLALVRGRGAV